MERVRPGIMSDVENLAEWKDRVLERDGYKCVNCERTGRVAACFIVPPEGGGKLRTSNGATVCRECRIASESARVLPTRIENKTPLNFFVGRELHATLKSYVHNGSKFGSVSALVRRMVFSFITESELYEDLAQWQDDGSDVKINGWIDGSQYEVFKSMCQERSLTYTDALKGLLLLAVEGYTPESTQN